MRQVSTRDLKKFSFADSPNKMPPPKTQKAPQYPTNLDARGALLFVAFKRRKAVIRRPFERKPWHRPTFPHKDMQYHGR